MKGCDLGGNQMKPEKLQKNIKEEYREDNWTY